MTSDKTLLFPWPIPWLVGLAAVPGLAAPEYEDHAPRLLIEAPSEAVVGEATRFSVLLAERWGREGPEVPTAGVERSARLEVTTTDPSAVFSDRVRIGAGAGGKGVGRIEFGRPGLHRIRVEGEAGLGGESQPIRVLAEPPAERIYWGDLQGHLHTPGAGHAGALPPESFAHSLAEGLAFARDVSLLDFCAFTPHLQTAGGLARASGPDGSPWDALLRAVEAAHAPGEFVVFPGFEWQGNEGDHCVLYPAPGPIEAPADFLALARAARARGALLTAHEVFLPTRFEPRVALSAIEVMRDSRSMESLGRAALHKGVAVPFLGCSDTHGGALGATSLTGLRAPALTRAAILEAIRRGRTWATNGERIVLELDVDLSGDLPVLRGSGLATGPVDHVELFRNGKLVGQIRDLPDTHEFRFSWPDPDLLRLECLDRTIAYHCRVVQTTPNRYDPSRRDVAVSSPVPVTPAARHFDGAHARRGGRDDQRPGDALLRLRAAWDPFRPAPDRALRDDLPEGAPIPDWSAAEIEELRSAVRQISRLATEDSTLLALASGASPLPAIAEALAAIRDLREREREIVMEGTPSPARVKALHREAREAHARATSVRSRGLSADSSPLPEAWFGARLLMKLVDDPLQTIAAIPKRSLPPSPVRWWKPAQEVSRVEIEIDPRTLAALRPVSRWSRALRRETEERWGYTEPSIAPAEHEAAIRVRVEAADDSLRGSVRSGEPSDPWDVPLASSDGDWIAVLDRAHVPWPGDAPPVLELDPPARLSALVLETPNGAPLDRPGRLRSLTTERATAATVAKLVTDGGPVEVALVSASGEPLAGGSGGGTTLGRPRPRLHALWSGVLEEKSTAIAFPEAAGGASGRVMARWGFAGWNRAAGVTIPGHDVIRPAGLCALPDGRALVAFGEELAIATPGTGRIERVFYPLGRRHEPGRELSLAPLADGRVLVRGAFGPGGGWVALLDCRTGIWSHVPPGPETGSVAVHPDGGFAWLTGRTLRRRDEGGRNLPDITVDVSGRLLGFDSQRHAVVGLESGEAVRVDPITGGVTERIAGHALTVDRYGAVLLLDGLDARHPELAREIRIVRALPGGAFRGPYPLAIRASPVLDPPVLVAPTPDALLVLGGTTWWRRLPDHDWWGVTVDRWEPVWAGETGAE